MPSLPSYINTELNLQPPPALDHVDIDPDSDDEDADRYELVTFRIPVDVKLSDLNGIKIDLSKLSGSGMPIQDGKFVLSQGDKNENETFRVLVPDNKTTDDSSDSDSDSDDQSDSKFLLHPSQKAFSHHFNLTKNSLVKKSETELAPSVGPEPVGCTLKHSYSHIPQRKGLKRRWMPLGNKQGAIAISPQLVTMKYSKATTTKNEDAESVEEATPTKPETKKRRRSNSTSSNGKKRSRSKDPAVKQEKEKKSEKKAKKAKKSKKQKKDEDAMSV